MADFSLEDGEFEPEECRDQLFTWSLPLFNKYETIHDLSDGDGFVEALHYVEKTHFADLTAASGQIGFLQELRDRMVEYIEERLQDGGNYSGRKSLSDLKVRLQEDVDQGGTVAVSRLLQLLLVCAVLCSGKEEHITKIRDLDEKVTVAISKAILQILPVKSGTGAESDEEPVSARSYTNGAEDCDKCAALQTEISHLNSERKRLTTANARLKTELESAVDIDNERSPANQKLSQLQKEAASLKESFEKVEYLRDELRVKCEDLQDRLTSSIVENEQLKRKVAEMDKLKDEVNEWKQTATQLKKYENQVKVYERKIDDVGELKQQMKAMENRNTELMKRNIELEQENAQVAVLNSEVETLRNEISTRDQEHKLTVKRLEIAHQERTDLQDQLDELERRNRNLESENTSIQRQSDDLEEAIPIGMSLATEMIPTSVKEDLLRLQMENEELTLKLKSQLSVEPVVAPVAPAVALVNEDGAKTTLVVDHDGSSAMNKEIVLNEVEVQKPPSSDAVLAQRDAQIQALEKELHFARQNYGQQQKLMTAAWYRMTLKAQQQALDARLVAASSDTDRQPSFLEEQRKALIAPVSNGSRTGSAAPSPLPSARLGSRSFMR